MKRLLRRYRMDNGEKWFSVDTSGIPKEETIKIARSVKKILKN